MTTTEPRVNAMLNMLIEKKGSDLHLQAGYAPRARIQGEMGSLSGFENEVIEPDAMEALVRQMMTPTQWARFEDEWELDMAYSLSEEHRFRVNVLRDQGHVGVVMRVIPTKILTFEQLKLPEDLRRFTQQPKGLVLVTGPTGSGKSTTLAAMIDDINRTKRHHIITIEDPVEFTHKSLRSTIRQREVGRDTKSFGEALRRVLREDPDVILLGELRDKETIETAITAAETGHLVFGTLHTSSAAETINRVVGVFPSDAQDQIRTQLASSLIGVVAQTLCRTKEGGRVAALEIMVTTDGIRNNIRKNDISQIDNALMTGARDGQMTLNLYLANLVQRGVITAEVALSKTRNTKDLRDRLGSQFASR